MYIINDVYLYKKISLAGDESDAVQADSKLEGTLQNTLEQKGKKQVLLVFNA